MRAEDARLGTRFLVFPQPPFIPGYERPEVVWVSTPLGEIGAGPADRRIYVVDPAGQKEPYAFPYLPPYAGLLNPPAEPGPDGHFDHLAVGSPEFVAAHTYACVRRMLDICESYHGREIPWFFESTYERLEIVPRLSWDNAHAGFGFLEMGEDDADGRPFPFALNFDSVAHETGHLILLSLLGTPQGGAPPDDFFAHHEGIGDFLSLLGLLFFDTALDRILRRTRGNLLLTNELDRFAELSTEKQVRVLNHSLKMSDVGHEIHDRSRPFTGALFDTLIEIYQVLLVERGLSRLDPREVEEVRLELTQADIDREFAITRDEYEFHHFEVKAALTEARDIVGEALVRSWRFLDPDTISLSAAAEALLDAIEMGRGRRFTDRAFGNFVWRGIL
jgi:hypothetical protein